MKRTSPSSRAATAASRAPPGAEGRVPVDGVDQVVELPQVHVVDTEALQRALELGPGVGGPALARLGGQEEVPRRPFQPGPDPQFGIPVTGGHVDVVDAGPMRTSKTLVRLGLSGGRKCGRPEQGPCALVTRAPEGCCCYAHLAFLCSLWPLPLLALAGYWLFAVRPARW